MLCFPVTGIKYIFKFILLRMYGIYVRMCDVHVHMYGVYVGIPVSYAY